VEVEDAEDVEAECPASDIQPSVLHSAPGHSGAFLFVCVTNLQMPPVLDRAAGFDYIAASHPINSIDHGIVQRERLLIRRGGDDTAISLSA
jgi:hypothetical protein